METALAQITFRTLFELANDAIIVADAETQVIVDVNQRASEWLDRDLNELRGLHVREIHPAEDWEHLSAHFSEHAHPDASSVLSCHLRRKDGSRFPCELSARRISINGRILAIGIFRDLSERVRAMEEIRLRNVALQSIQAGVSIADARLPDLPLIYVNGGFEKITGYKAREAVGRSCRFLQGDERDQDALKTLREALREGHACDVRLRNFRKDGKPFWNELRISPVYNETDELTHFVGIQIDVTERVESRRRIEESERRYRALAESVEDIIMRRERCGRIFFLSPSVERNLGWKIQDLVGTNYHDLIHPEDRALFAENLQGLCAEREATTLTYRVRDARGNYLWIESRETFLCGSDDADEIVSIGRDVTLRKRAEEEVRKSLDRERELSQLKSRFIQMVSHEFRTPMTGIRASSAYLREYGDQLGPAKRERHYANIERSLARMNRMVDDVLFLSRNETKALGCQPVALDPVQFAEQLIEETHHLFPGREIQFETTLSSEERYLLDADLLRHIFQNLLSNALKYSPPHSPVRFSLNFDEDLVWEVSDGGIGVPAEDQETLFEPFFRCGNTGNVNGTGLGLYIVKRSTEIHQGTVQFSSREGGGTTFTVRLPAHSATLPQS